MEGPSSIHHLPSISDQLHNRSHKMNDVRDEFPIGMNVLAVDSDRTCLKILEILLQRCRYHVTTAENAITALKLLRENKNRFDLVISDVNMPEMDGFKLLELVGLEMDLPVILLSANDDPEMVMKGISLGACYYMLKPVRIEELQLIWQHVIRRKRITKSNNQSTHNVDNSAVTANSNQNEKPSKKRKYQNEDDVEGHDNDHDNEGLTAPKKPRVVWSAELQSKFVAAVNQLGLDKALPRKILALMNVENLTRENVASHLQKFRLQLKKNSCVANQQPNNMVSQFSPSCNDIWTKSYLPNSGTLQGGNLSGASSITPLSSQPHDSLTDMNSQGWINHNQDGSYHSPEIGSSSVDSLIPLNDAEPEGSLVFSFCDSLQMNHDWIADLTEEAQRSGISNDLFSLDDLFSDIINEETQLGNQFGAVHTIIM